MVISRMCGKLGNKNVSLWMKAGAVSLEETDRALIDNLYNSAGDHNLDWIGFPFAQKDYCADKVDNRPELEVSAQESDMSAGKKGGNQDRYASCQDHGDNGWAQGFQDALH